MNKMGQGLIVFIKQGGMNMFNKKLKEYNDYVCIESKLNEKLESSEEPEPAIELMHLMRNELLEMKKKGHICKVSSITSIQSNGLSFYFIVPRESYGKFIKKLAKVNTDYESFLVDKDEFSNLFDELNDQYSVTGRGASSWNIINNMEFVAHTQKSLKKGEHVSTIYNYFLPDEYENNDNMEVQILVSTNTKRDILQEFVQFNK